MSGEGRRISKAIGWIVGILVDILVTLIIPGSSIFELILAFIAGVAAYYVTTRAEMSEIATT